MATTVMNSNDCFRNGNDRLRKGKLPRLRTRMENRERSKSIIPPLPPKNSNGPTKIQEIFGMKWVLQNPVGNQLPFFYFIICNKKPCEINDYLVSYDVAPGMQKWNVKQVLITILSKPNMTCASRW